MALNAVIIDDERTVRELLRGTLESEFSELVTIVGEADDVQPAIEIITNTKPDVVFLDIRMRTGTGFDVLEGLQDQDFEVVFVTAYDEYAVEAFKFSAFGYLLKPIKLSDLEIVIKKLWDHIEEQKSAKNKRLKVLVENYAGDKVEKLVIKNMKGFQVIELKKIVRLQSEANYTHFLMLDGSRYTSSRTIKQYEELLGSHGFFRIHQQHVINLSHVVSYEKGEGGSVILADGNSIPVSRKRKPALMQKFL